MDYFTSTFIELIMEKDTTIIHENLSAVTVTFHYSSPRNCLIQFITYMENKNLSVLVHVRVRWLTEKER